MIYFLSLNSEYFVLIKVFLLFLSMVSEIALATKMIRYKIFLRKVTKLLKQIFSFILTIPSIRTNLKSAVSIPKMIFNKVDFPEPFLPNKPMISLFHTLNTHPKESIYDQNLNTIDF
jgi:hypothetical protein